LLDDEPNGTPTVEETLDPRTPQEWEEARRAGYRLVDQMIAQHQGLAEAPCWQRPPAEALAAMRRAPDAEGEGTAAALATAERAMLPYGTGNLHPRFWGWVMGGATVPGILGMWMSAAMNANVFAGDQGPVHLEHAVIEWMRGWLGFPEGASGLLTSGASMATLLGLVVAQHRATDGAARAVGPMATAGLRIYASAATHNSVVKAAQLMGLGATAVRMIRGSEGCGDERADERADLAAIERAICEDKAAGLRPFCLIANLGTVGTGAIDPVIEMRALADRHGLWLHGDGAIGAMAYLSPVLRPRFAGLPSLDSLAFDLHKWSQVPYDAGCLLVRDGRLHRAAFEYGATYLGSVEGGLLAHGSHAFNALTPLLSRPDRALKVWTTFRALGTRRLAETFERSVAQASYLAELVAARPELELLAPTSLNLVCFRFRGHAAAKPSRPLDELNERILIRLQESGFCVMSPFRVGGQFCLRVCLSNHRTRHADLRALVRRVCEEGAQLAPPS
jgi:aromatic-L-amino-acid/L-tryptophan decarboxylase